MADNTQDMRKMGFEVGFNIYDDENGLPNLTKNIQKAVAESEKLTRSLSDVEKVTSSLSSSTAKTSETTEKASKAQGNFAKEVKDAWQSGLSTASEAMNKLKKRSEELSETLKQAKPDDKEYKKTAAELAKVENAYSQIERTVYNSSQKIEKYSEDTQQKISALHKKEIDERVRDSQRETALKKSELDQQVRDYRAAMDDLNAQMKAPSAVSNGNTFSQSLKSSILTGGIELLGVRALADAFENLGTQIVEINYNTVNTQRIMQDFSKATADAITDSAIQIAKESGILVTDAQEIQAAWVRINDKYANSAELLDKISNATAKFMNVGEVEDAEDAVNLVNAAMLQFKMDVDEGIETLNKWAYMADKTALGTADEFGESASKIGGFMKSVEGNMDDAIVMTSMVGDQLAKSGDEAGNSIKTILSYLTRTKTMNLFDDIAQSTGDATYSLREANGEFKDFAGLMDTVSRAYNMAMQDGNDVLAKQIQEALGATRQGDVALTLLQNWSEKAGEYYAMIENATGESGSYLEQQNAALMETFKNQWNALYASIAEFGTVIANSGVLDGMTSFMNVTQSILEGFSNLDPTFSKMIVNFASLSLAIAGLKKLADVTGLVNSFNESLVHGSSVDRKRKASIDEVTSSYFSLADQMKKDNQLTKAQELQVQAYATKVAELKRQYNEGTLTAKQYNAEMNRLNLAQEKGALSAQRTAEADRKLAEIEKTLTASGDKETASKIANTAATDANTSATGRQAFSLGSLSAAQSINTAKTYAATAAQNALNIAINTGKTLLSMFTSPLSLLSIGITVLSTLFSNLGNSSEKQSERISDLQQSISELNGELDTLKAKSQNEALTTEESNRLKYLEDRIDLEERLKKIEEEKQARTNFYGDGGLGDFVNALKGPWSQKRAKEQGQSDLDELKKVKEEIENINRSLSDNLSLRENLKNKQKNLSEESEEWKKLQSEIDKATVEYGNQDAALEEKKNRYIELTSTLTEFKSKVETLLQDDTLTKGQKSELSGLLDDLNNAIPTAEEVDKVLGDVKNTASGINMDDFYESVEASKKSLSSIQSDIDLINSGKASADDLIRMMRDYKEDDFYVVANAGAKEQVDLLEQIKSKKASEIAAGYDSQINGLAEQRRVIYEQIAQLQQQANAGGVVNGKEIEDAIGQLENLNSQLQQVHAAKELTIYVDTTDIENAANIMNDLVSSTTALVDAQNQLASGTALSAEELFNLAMQYPELLYQSGLFNDTSVAGQQEAINAVLAMKEQEFDAELDVQIQQLQVEAQACQDQIDIEAQKQSLLDEINLAGVNARLGQEDELTGLLTEYSNLQGQNKVDLENGKIKVSQEALIEEGQQNKESNENLVSNWNTVKNKWVEVFQNGGNGVVDAFRQTFNLAADIGKNFLTKFWNNLKNAVLGKTTSTVESYSDDSGNNVNIQTDDVAFTADNATIGGQSISDWVNIQKQQSQKMVDAAREQYDKTLAAINNLEQFKGMSIQEVQAKYNPVASNQSVIKAQEEAAKAAEKAAREQEQAAKTQDQAAKNAANEAAKQASASQKAAEQIIATIERITKEYERNVESLQDRIVKALKKKYQEMYDERKKQLEKEQEAQLKVHNDRIDQLRDEIDKIKGDTPEDKQAELGRLQDELAGWMKDDSTLGKAKQKELMGKIKDLKQEIQIDDLEDQIDKEQDKIEEINNYFKQLLSSDSPLYDPVLKNIDAQMTNQALYAEANEMIRREQTQQIIDLLLAYDPDYSGIAQLMGQTAGQVIAMEVIKALNNYRDLRDNTITANGGKYTMSGGSGGSGGSSGSSGGSGGQRYHTVVGGDPWGDTLWDLAVHYYGDGSKWDKIYNANRDQVSDPDLIYPGQRLLIPFKTGGHTSSSEGVAYLDKKERVLTDQQTRAFDQMVFDFLPKINTSLLNVQSPQNGGNKTVNYDKELVSIKVDKVVNNTPFDIENGEQNLNKMVKKTLQKSGMNLR